MTSVQQAISPKRTRRHLLIAVVAALVVTTTILAIKHGRHHIWPKRFHVVEPGQLYRSGELQAGPLRDVIRDYQLQTIVTLLGDEPDDPLQQQEAAIAAETGVRQIRIPMPGDGRGEFDALNRAADVIADTSLRPMLVHCAGGMHRTGAAYAAYRLKYCGWSFEEAMREGHRYDLAIDEQPELIAHLRAYYRERILGGPSTATATP